MGESAGQMTARKKLDLKLTPTISLASLMASASSLEPEELRPLSLVMTVPVQKAALEVAELVLRSSELPQEMPAALMSWMVPWPLSVPSQVGSMN